MPLEELSPLDMVEKLLEVTSHVNDYEEKLLYSLQKRLEEGHSLSSNQDGKLEEIYERVFRQEQDD